MARLSLKAVEERVVPLAGRETYDREFIFDLLLAYGKPQGNVTRLRNGSLNIAVDPSTEVAQKNVVYFKETTGDPLEVTEDLKSTPAVVRFSTRFVIVTDYVELVAHDIKTNETIGFPIREIDQHFTFFLPWAGMEKAQYVAESHADVKAAERMGKLFDELLQGNPGIFDDERGRHSLNIFFTRLLFCFFAEDTGIFGDNQFTNAIGSQTQSDGSDLAEFLTDLFKALDTENAADKPKHLAEFPYVNGRLFTVKDDQVVPRFTKQARDELIASGTLIWRDINPDIFGSMFQAIVTPGKRSDLGQHYTSVPNILKTIEPLFLDDLKTELNEAQDSERRLMRLLDRITDIKVFDPAFMRKSGVSGDIHELLVVVAELKDQDSPPRRYTRGGRSSATLDLACESDPTTSRLRPRRTTPMVLLGRRREPGDELDCQPLTSPRRGGSSLRSWRAPNLASADPESGPPRADRSDAMDSRRAGRRRASLPGLDMG
jgi:hypothetical protein